VSRPESSSTTITIPVKKTTLIRISAIVIAIVLVASVLFLFFNRPYPLPQIVYQKERQEEYQFFIDVGVRNSGADGWVRVYAQLESPVQFELNDTRLYLENAEAKSLTFTFLLESGQGSVEQMIKTTVWAQPD